jgi:hypothetical protein
MSNKTRRSPPPPAIGSPAWYGDLLALGVQRRSLERALASAIGGKTGEELDAHAVRFDGSSSAEAAALWLLFHELRPGYGAMMYLRHVWLDLGPGDDVARRWFVRQLAAMLLHGSEAVRKSASYSLWVDYFETARPEVDLVFRRLVAELPRAAWAGLLPYTGPVPWEAKRYLYRAASFEPGLHEGLARAIAACVWDIYGSIDVAEAAALFGTIDVVDPELAAIGRWLGGPLRLQVSQIGFVESSEDPWPDSFLMRFSPVRTPWALLRRSTLALGAQDFGVVEHLSPPLKTEWVVRRLGAPADERSTHVVRVRGSQAAAPALLGREIEAWPRGSR